jgi:hypothetical protein
MKSVRSIMLALALVGFLVAAVHAADAEKTIKGTITCAKCDLKKEDKCTTVIVAKEDGKDVIYYLDDKAGKANHAKICKEGKKGEVTGTVEKKGDKNIITVKKDGVKFD